MMEYKVQLIRPERRFGWALAIGRRDEITGQMTVLRMTEDGLALWEPYEQGTEVTPVIEGDEQLFDAIADAWIERNDRRAPLPVQDILLSDVSDARGTRDRLLSIVEGMSQNADRTT
jgi:hypothetical protein